MTSLCVTLATSSPLEPPEEPPVDPFLTQLSKGYNEVEVAEIKQYMAEWNASTYISVAQSILDHASRKEFDPLKYLRKAHNFNSEESSKSAKKRISS